MMPNKRRKSYILSGAVIKQASTNDEAAEALMAITFMHACKTCMWPARFAKDACRRCV